MRAQKRHKWLTLTDPQIKRLERQRVRRGMTATTYMSEAILRQIEADEAEVQQQRAERQQRREDRAARCRPATRPAGLGIVGGTFGGGLDGAQLGRAKVEAEDPAPAPAPVVFNVGGSAAPAEGDLIPCLASFVVGGGPEIERDERMRLAVTVLRSGAASDEEREARARQLDEAVAQAEAERRAGPRRALSVAGLAEWIGL